MPKEKKEVKTRCEKCGGSQTYIRIKTKERVCQECGEIAPIKGHKVAAQ